MNPISSTMQLAQAFGRQVKDGFENALTGLGIGSSDKRTGGSYKYRRMPVSVLENFHDTSDIASTIVNKPAELATKKWLTHTVANQDGDIDLVKAIVNEEERLGVQEKFEQALAWSRLYGGSAIYIDVEDGLTLDEPLNTNRIQKINSLVVLHKGELQRHLSLNSNIRNKNFGKPDFYTISGRAVEHVPVVHHSRLIRFEGRALSDQGFRANDYWHDSFLTDVKDIIRDYDSAYNTMFSALQDFDVDVLKINDLSGLVAAGEDENLQARLKVMRMAKSIMSSIIIDAENESFEKLQRQFQNIDKMLEKCDQRLLVATKGMPHTLIFGDGSTGTLGASGESEQNGLNDFIDGIQSKNLKNQLTRFYTILFASRRGPTKGIYPESWTYIFNSLNEPTDKQRAEVRKLTAETDDIYLTHGVVSADEIAKSRFGGDEYSTETMIDLKAREEQKITSEIEPEDAEKELEGLNG